MVKLKSYQRQQILKEAARLAPQVVCRNPEPLTEEQFKKATTGAWAKMYFPDKYYEKKTDAIK